MPKFQEHFDGSFYRIKLNSPQFLIEHREVICQLLAELHNWFDEFSGTKGEGYDFTDRRKIRHRAMRHHWEGIWEAVAKFTQKYGPEYHDIIEQEAKQHVKDDMLGKILYADDYLEPGFWSRIGAN
jgi:hypothetical protein